LEQTLITGCDPETEGIYLLPSEKW
jgi:hypothetical protein